MGNKLPFYPYIDSDSAYCLEYLIARSENQPIAYDNERLLKGINSLRELAVLGAMVKDEIERKRYSLDFSIPNGKLTVYHEEYSPLGHSFFTIYDTLYEVNGT